MPINLNGVSLVRQVIAFIEFYSMLRTLCVPEFEECDPLSEKRLKGAELEIQQLKRKNADLHEELMSLRSIVKAVTPLLKKNEEDSDIAKLQVALWRSLQFPIKTEIVLLQKVVKKVIDKFHKGHHQDSSMYPPETLVVQTVKSYLASCGENSRLIKLCNVDNLKCKFHNRERRNRRTRGVRDGYRIWNQITSEDVLSEVSK